MAPNIAALINELKMLRKGQGIQGADLLAKSGVVLRQICGVVAGDPPWVAREKILFGVERMTRRLPAPMYSLGRALFGFDDFAGKRYGERLKTIGSLVDRDVRTMQRRADEAIGLMAELTFADELPVSGRPGPPWHTASLAVRLILTGPDVEVFETRRIRSHRPSLAEIEHSLTVPPADPSAANVSTVHIESLGGGEIHSRRLVSSNRIAFQVRPPRALAVDELHEFTFRVRLPRIAPFYVCTPTYPCDRFSLQARFGPDRVPSRIWIIDGEFSMEVNDPLPIRKAVKADSLGEVSAEFVCLEPAKSYGLGWEPVA